MSGLHELERTILALTGVMAAETKAFQAQDLVGAAAQASAKQAAVTAFLLARGALTAEELRPLASQLAVVVDRLRDGVRENRVLLEQAIAVQGRVVQTLAVAAKRSTPAAGNYGRSAGAFSPLAISVRA